jgi:hypothetical protein
MTKPVAVFRSGVIRDSRHAVRLGENGHLVLFPSFSRYITSWAISATWRASIYRSRCYRPGSGIWLVVGWLPCQWDLEAGSRRVGVGHSDPQRPSTGSICYLEFGVWRTMAHFAIPRIIQLGEWVWVWAWAYITGTYRRPTSKIRGKKQEGSKKPPPPAASALQRATMGCATKSRTSAEIKFGDRI